MILDSNTEIVNEIDTLRNILIKEFGSDAPKNFDLKKIKKGVFAISINKKNINSYVNTKGEIIFNIKPLARNYYFQKASILAGYKEVKKEDGIYEMYKIKGIEKNGNIINSKLGKKLDKYSIEYYQAWKNINFFEDILRIKSLLISSEGGLTSLDIEVLEIFSKSGALRIKDLEQLKKQGQITEETFKKALALYQTKEDNLLLQQIGDKRFERVNEGITNKEIENYYKKGYISEDLYNLAKETLIGFQTLEERRESEIKTQIGENKKAIKNL